MLGKLTESNETARQLREVLLGYLQAAITAWPGGDGLTLENMLDYYPEAVAAGEAPDWKELLRRHPELAIELQGWLAAKDRWQFASRQRRTSVRYLCAPGLAERGGSMTKEAKKYDLDLAQMADEALVILVQESTFQPAADELLLRYYERMNQLIAVRVRQRGIAADVQDAQQNGVFAILEAIAVYDTREVAKPRGCSFRTFVRMVVTARCCDFIKRVRRTENRYRRLDERRAEQGSDPVEILAQQEETARLHGAVERLDEPLRRLWHELTCGKKPPQIAREQGISYDRVKRQRRRLLAQLAAALADERSASADG